MIRYAVTVFVDVVLKFLPLHVHFRVFTDELSIPDRRKPVSTTSCSRKPQHILQKVTATCFDTGLGRTAGACRPV